MLATKEKSSCFYLVLSILIALLLIGYGADGVRGTDQYWYLADVQRIVNGTPPVTNTYFPAPILKNNAVQDPNYIHHNSPMLYLVALLASAFSVYGSWIAVNVICHFIVSYVLFSLACKFTDESIATIVTCFYLISPIAIWQSLNPLLEMYFSALLALVLFSYFNREHRGYTIFLWLLLALGILSHPIFLVPAIFYGFVWGYEYRHLRLHLRITISTVFFASVLALFYVKESLFPSSFQPSLSAVIASAVPGKSNMFWHYAVVLPEIDAELLISKVTSAIRKHIVELKFVPLYFFTNVGILAAIWLTIFRLKRWWTVILPLGLFGVLYIAMIFLQQNHPRFQQIVALVSFLFVALLFDSLKGSGYLARKGIVRFIVIGTFIGFLLIDSYLAFSARTEALKERIDLEALEEQVSGLIEDGARVLVVDVMPHNPFSFVFQPSSLLFVRTDMLGKAEISKAAAIFLPNYIVMGTGRTSLVPNPIEYRGSLTSNMFGDLAVFRVRNL